MEFRILGPVEVEADGERVRLGPQLRAVLAVLLLEAGQVVPRSRLAELLWGEPIPDGAATTLRSHILHLRRALAPKHPGQEQRAVIVTEASSYGLRFLPEQLDATRFERLAEAGRRLLAAGDPGAAGNQLRRALDLWRGPALTDLADRPFAVRAATRLEELRMTALEARFEADLALGRHHQVTGEIEALVRLHPVRERLRGQLMLALYRSGRQAEALAAYRAARTTLVKEFGIEPSAGLQRLEHAILTQDPALEPMRPPQLVADLPDQGPPSGLASAGPDARSGAMPSDQAGTRSSTGLERKLVTVLFCNVDDPVAEDQRDPEDATQVFARYLTRARVEIEGYGGTVEQTVAGTALALFGVPRTREDDPERAVRAALAIRAALAGPASRVRLRIAVATGEALVRLGAETGQRVTGDLLRICGRLLEATPVGAIQVSAATERATARTISYSPASMGPLNGHSERAPVWSVLGSRSRASRDLTATGVPLVGRDHELDTLRAVLEHVRTDYQPRLVTLLGAPGTGKSRLVAEFARTVEADPELIAWRQGRSLRCGADAMFDALAEIVKSEAGILTTDSPERVEHKLTEATTHALGDRSDALEAAWVAGHLRRLIGTGSATSGDVRSEEATAAWRRFIHAAAARRPLVLVVEDLHRADDALLDFLKDLVEPAAIRQGVQVPLLVIATARPELVERRPEWCSHEVLAHSSGTRSRAITVPLEPLSDADAANLLDALLTHHRLPQTVGAELVARVGGNPLFAEEYVRMLRDHGLQAGGAGAFGQTVGRPNRVGRRPAASDSGAFSPAIPESVHAIIAARLDALPAAEKAVVRDAAVLGQATGADALAAIGGHDPQWLGGCLQRLVAKEFLQPTSHSSMTGEAEYVFRHVLIRDVAYGQLPRAERAERHCRAATWLEALAGGSIEDLGVEQAPLLAHHLDQALTFARAAGWDGHDQAVLAVRARLALRAAGDRAADLGLHTTAARYFGKALDLWPGDDPDYPDLELRAGRSRCYGEGSGEELLARSRDGFLGLGAPERAAEAEMLLGELACLHGHPDRARHVDRAVALVADAPPSRSKAAVLEGCTMHLMVADRHAEARRLAAETLEVAEVLGLRDHEANMLGVIGISRIASGDSEGIKDLQHCIAICEQSGSPRSITWNINLAFALAILGDLPRCSVARAAAKQAAERFGSVRWLRWIELEQTAEHYWNGRWDEVMRTVDALTARSGPADKHVLECECRIWRGRILLARGSAEPALEDANRALVVARESGDRQNLDPALAFGARALLAAGRASEAGTLVDELLVDLRGHLLKPDLGIDFPVVLTALGYTAGMLDRAGILPSRWLDAARAFVAGNPRQAAEVYASIGSRPDEAYARLVAGRQLLEKDRAPAGRRQLKAAVDFFRSRTGSHPAELMGVPLTLPW